jgi:two-component system, OmpR family, KDP operon response regulator KdpE
MAQAMNAELFVVYTDLGQDTSEENQRTLNANIRFAENVGRRVARLTGKNVASAVAEFVNEKHITQVVFGRSAPGAGNDISISRDSPVPARRSGRGRAHCDAGTELTPMSEHKHILVVDDESQITRVLRTSLSSHGYDIRVANDGETALEIMKDWTPDLVITDLAMPNMDGLELCRRLRTKTQVPIIVLSVRGEERTKVKALDAGADDYVTKPFGMEELLARVRANLRRQRTDESEMLRLRWAISESILGARTVIVKDRAVHLTPKEFDLLVYLARHAGKVVTHRALLGAVWGGESTEQVEYLRVFVAQLRKKLEPSPNSPKYIVTDPWVGYRFEPGA